MIARKRLALLDYPQPLIATVLTASAAALLLGSWWSSAFESSWTSWGLGLAALLAVLVIIAYRFPIHFDTNTKVVVFSVPVYMLALLVPPALAGTAVAVAFLAAESMVRTERGLYWSDIWTAASRWVLIVLAVAYLTGSLRAAGLPMSLVLLLGAGCLFAGDVLTMPLVLVAMNQRRPLRMIPHLIRISWRVEAVQYVLGSIGVLLALYIPWALLLVAIPVYLVYVSFRRACELQDNTKTLLQQMADLVDQRDAMTEQHSRRVADLCADILAEMKVGRKEAELIIAAARVHDLGKVSVPDAILYKPGPLMGDEWTLMKAHVDVGANMLEQSLRSGHQGHRLAQIIRGHHERWDGQGYPNGVAGADIPLGGRVLAVADAFDAMTCDRPYRARMSEMQAVVTLQQGRKTQWDPSVVDAFLRTRNHAVPATPVMPGKPTLAGEYRP